VAEDLTGWKEDQAMGQPLADVFHIVNEFNRNRCENPVGKVLQTGGIIGLANNTILISKNGKESVVADSGAPIKDSQNKIIGAVLVFRDITDKRKMEAELVKVQKLESSRQSFRPIFYNQTQGQRAWTHGRLFNY